MSEHHSFQSHAAIAAFHLLFLDSYGGSKTEVPNEYRKRSAEFFPERFDMPMTTTTGVRDEIVPAASVLRLLNIGRGQ